MKAKRIKKTQESTAYPKSQSVHQSLLQVWDERVNGCEPSHFSLFVMEQYATYKNKL